MIPLNVTETFDRVNDHGTVSAVAICVARLDPKIATTLPAETGRPGAKLAASTTPAGLMEGAWPNTGQAAMAVSRAICNGMNQPDDGDLTEYGRCGVISQPVSDIRGAAAMPEL